ncbi:MAG TPA: GGDEF domain-containing protein [Solirubrobacteraceae bacterium]|jgi:diguanylate cyclase (GGDEF)-like protein|nr:GGDEF domain-containing protein [Solirubrobacteraceae bacterium]
MNAGRQGVTVRIGAFLFFGGAAITAVATAAPHSEQLDVLGFAFVAVFQLVCGLVVLTLPARFRGASWIPPAIVMAGVFAVSAAVYCNGERFGGPPAFNEFFYVWPAFYIGYFFRPRGIAASVTLIGAAYAGVLNAIGTTGSAAFTRWIVTLSVVAGAAVALHILRRSIDRLLQQLRDTARTDALTQLLNRRGFEERFELELERTRRTGDPLTLLVGDLDRFKELNDRFGHAAGDATLATVARTLGATARTIDTVARVGGEEFALLLPNTDAVGGLEAAERLRTSVAGTVGSDGAPLTISFGVAEVRHADETPAALMHAADTALYAAKAAGRNCSVVHDPESMSREVAPVHA